VPNDARIEEQAMKILLLASLCVAGALTGCGGGGDDTPPPTSQVPASASESTDGFVSYLKALVASDADTLPPVDVGNVAPPADDTSMPVPVN
jgi:hypothetical protein